MPHRFRVFLARHPLLRKAMIWAIPALVFGAFLRALLLSYLPYAYWGSDSRSYFSFAHRLLFEGAISLDEKRRFLYPIFTAFVALLPGAPLRWLAILQHLLGLATLLPLAYVLRKSLRHWRVLLIPITVLYAGWPMVLWYEHELLGETLCFAAVVWAFAGWCAWVQEPQRARAQRLFWFFFVPFAIAILTKPSARFLWPGVALGFLIVLAWQRLGRAQWIALGLLVAATLFVGSKKQGAWLLYVAVFPLTQTETPSHADYKAEIRADVRQFRDNISTYYLEDEWPFNFLESPGKQTERPLWARLGRDDKARARLYTDLAVEGIKAEPLLFLYLGWQKLVASMNPSEFKETRFRSGYTLEKFEHHYEEAQQDPGNVVRLAFNFRQTDVLPAYADFQHRIAPHPGSWMEETVVHWVAFLERVADFVRLPNADERVDRQIWKTRLTPLGYWLIAAVILALARPVYRRTFGVWTLVAASYLGGVFLVSQINPRYFAIAWPVLIPLLAVPADTLLSLIFRRRAQPAPEPES